MWENAALLIPRTKKKLPKRNFQYCRWYKGHSPCFFLSNLIVLRGSLSYHCCRSVEQARPAISTPSSTLFELFQSGTAAATAATLLLVSTVARQPCEVPEMPDLLALGVAEVELRVARLVLLQILNIKVAVAAATAVSVRTSV